MAKILVWLNTYNREALLKRFIHSVLQQMGDHKVDLFIFNDKGVQDYEDIKRHHLVKLFYTFNEHCGREHYWKLINVGLQYIKQYKDDYDLFIKTDDDMLLCDNFFNICLDSWYFLQKSSPRLFSLDILSAPKQRGRTLRGDEAQLVDLNKSASFYKTQWVDMNFIFNIKALNEINFEIVNCRSSNRSSGVGLWLTRIFNSIQYDMYQSPTSLLIHEDHPSAMHTLLRKKSPIVTRGMK